jgi:hypothetical protein
MKQILEHKSAANLGLLANNTGWKDINKDSICEFLPTLHANFKGCGIYSEMSYYGAVRIDNAQSVLLRQTRTSAVWKVGQRR